MRLRSRLLASSALLFAVTSLAACSQGAPGDAIDGGSTTCPRDQPASCPSPPPSWANDVRPIIELRCNACHGEGGIEQSVFDYSTYQGVYANRGPILSQVYACRMPPPDASAPTPDERRSLLTWLVCGAPND